MVLHCSRLTLYRRGVPATARGATAHHARPRPGGVPVPAMAASPSLRRRRPRAATAVSEAVATLDTMTSSAPLPVWARDLIAFDTETTGVDTRSDRIVTASVVRLDAAGAVVAERDWLLDPGVEIPEAARRVHGISTELARAEGQDAAAGIAEIVALLRAQLAAGRPIAAYNAPYDLTLLHHEARRHGIEPLEAPRPVIDPLVIDRAVDRYRRGKRTLTAACAQYGVTLEDAHRASADAIAAGRVAQAIAHTHPELDLPADRLHDQQVAWAREQGERFAEYMRTRRGQPGFRARTAWPVG
ncbi:hypothetical protein GCM10022230_03890 [Pseudoclavibacter caeni]